MKRTININDKKIKEALDILRAVAHPIRMAIIDFIDKNKAINVNKIYKSLQLEQSITSQHLGILRRVGIVNTERDGKYIFYSLNYTKLEQMQKAVEGFVEEKKPPKSSKRKRETSSS